MSDVIVMSKADCVLCEGSGFVTPYPYNKHVRCNHKWSKGSFMHEYNQAIQRADQAKKQIAKWEKALETGTFE